MAMRPSKPGLQSFSRIELHMNPVEEIKRRLDIVEIIGESVNLQRSGRNYKAVCPFHAEKTPSFYVFPDKGTWHCFGGCATGGDIFSFVMRRDDIDFAGAVRLLAERAGVSTRRSEAVERTQRDRLRQANESTALFFQHGLYGSQAGQTALDYLTMRGVDRQTAEAFQLGYAPDSWDALREHLKGRGFIEPELLQAGLLVEAENADGAGKRCYDRFRHRLVVPIKDERGSIIGFGSRSLVDARHSVPGQSETPSTIDADSPKYVNTPQTPIFDKGAILYGLDRAMEQIRRSDLAVIVEGYMDVIAAHQHGYTNVVASMGTALTERQLGSLRRLTENVVLAFDPDSAGRAASERGDQVARQLGIQIKVMRLPKGRDPDELIRADPEKWPRLVTGAEVRELFRSQQVQSVPTEHGRRVSKDKATKGNEEERVDTGKAEETCLALILRHPQLKSQGLALSDDIFTVAANRQLFQTWRDSPESDLMETLPEELQPQLERILTRDLPPFDPQQAEQALSTCTSRLKKGKLRLRKTVSSQNIAEKEQKLGAERLLEQALKEIKGEASPQDLPEDESAVLMRDMEAGLELHDKPRNHRAELSDPQRDDD